MFLDFLLELLHLLFQENKIIESVKVIWYCIFITLRTSLCLQMHLTTDYPHVHSIGEKQKLIIIISFPFLFSKKKEKKKSVSGAFMSVILNTFTP